MVDREWTRRDTLTAIAFAVVSGLVRIPFRATSIFHGDSYGLAMGALYTWTAHPPGFIGYSTLVRLTNYLAGDITTSFAIVSITTTAVATAAAFALGRTMFGYAAGIVSGLFYATSLDVSYFAEVALTYAAEGAFATLAGLTAWLAISRNSPAWLVAASAVLAIGGSVRQTTLAFLLPLWLYALWRATPRWRVRIAAIALLFAVVFAWSVPNARNLRMYWDKEDIGYIRSVYNLQVRMAQYYDSSSFGRVAYEKLEYRYHWPLVELGVGLWNRIVPPGPDAPPEVKSASVSGSLAMLRYQTAKVLFYTCLACGLWTLLIFIGLKRAGRDRAIFLLLWVLPSFLFFALNHFGAWGYLLIFLAALAAAAAHGLVTMTREERRAIALGSAIAAIHAAVFLFMRPVAETSDRARIANVAVLQYGAPAIRASYARARSTAFTEDPRQLRLDCVTDECLRKSIPRDFGLPEGVRPMQPLF